MDDRDRRIEELERRLEELERRGSSMDRALDRSRAAGQAIIPEETRHHVRAAAREQLLAVRSLLDHWINRSSDDASGSDRSSRESIRVE
ncbi:MAG TPA: hypothetical protein VM305_11080 [Candidatus Limnocylindrales bacterium]|nr:hypothetical protein [Candidatus Limnocylindrales bacterium]